MFVDVNQLHSSLIFKGKAGAYQSGAPHVTPIYLALPANIRIGWKWMTVANTLAYYDTTKLTADKV